MFKEKSKKDLAFEQSTKDWVETFDSIADGLSIHDNNFTIINVNRAICSLLGLEREDIIGKKCFGLFHDLEGPLKACPLVKSKNTKKRESIEYYEKKIDKWLSVTVSPAKRNGRIVKYIHVVRDITTRKNNEIETIKKNKELEILNKVSVGRELKMIELKKEIAKLKKLR